MIINTTARTKAKKQYRDSKARGVDLIDQALAELRKNKVPGAPGLAAEELAGMRLANGQPLPASLRKFLGSYGPRDQFPGEWREGERLALDGVDFKTLLSRVYTPEVLSYFDTTPLLESLTGMCHPLEGDTPLSFLYVGEADSYGEYPILTLQDYDDVLEVVVSYPGLDVYLACRAGLVPPPSYYGGIIEHNTYGPMLMESVKANFPTLTKRRKQFVFNAIFLDREDEDG